MAARDILPFTSEPGGHHRIGSFALNEDETFDVGEPVRISSDGEIEECTSPVDAANEIVGFSAEPAIDANGVGRFTATTQEQPLVGVYLADSTRFITRNWATDAAATPAVPTLDSVGLVAGFVRDGNGVWFLDAGEEGVARVVRVLDANLRDLGNLRNAGAGVFVVFEMPVSQLGAQSALTDAP